MAEDRPDLVFAGRRPSLVRRVGELALRAFARAGGAPRGAEAISSSGVAVFRVAFAEGEGGAAPAIGAALDADGLTSALTATKAVILAGESSQTRTISGARALPLPVERLGAGPQDCAGLWLGAVGRLAGLPRESLSGAAEHPWIAKGFEYAQANYPELFATIPLSPVGRRAAVSAMEAAAAGALWAGCRLIARDSRSPIIGGPGVRVDAGDAASAAQMALGGALAGVRTLAAVAGGLSSGAAEAVRWAVRAEVPAVFLFVGDVDAPGPAIAPQSVGGLFRAMGAAFDVAERFHSPVSVLVRRELASRWSTLEVPVESAPPHRGLWASAEHGGAPKLGFERYAESESGVSPRAVPGQPGLAFISSVKDRGDRLDRKQLLLRRALAGDPNAFEAPGAPPESLEFRPPERGPVVLADGLKASDFHPRLLPDVSHRCARTILMKALREAAARAGILPKDLFVISALAGTPDPLSLIGTYGARLLPEAALAAAAGARFANPGLTVATMTAEASGGALGPLIEAARRNLDITFIWINGGGYRRVDPDLTRSVRGAGATFAARIHPGGEGQADACADALTAALGHRGFSWVESLGPCPHCGDKELVRIGKLGVLADDRGAETWEERVGSRPGPESPVARGALLSPLEREQLWQVLS